MIADPAVLAQTQAEWAAVQATKDRIARNLAGAQTGIGGMGVSHVFRNLTYGLWLLFAFSVFERVLAQLRHEGLFVSRSLKLGDLMASSRSALPWQDYDLVDEARSRRNDIAHRMAVLERGDTWRYVAAIEAELRAWRVL